MARSRHSAPATSQEKAERYDALNPLLNAMYREFQELSKKKQDGSLSKAKIAVVNRLLKDVLTILEHEPNRPYLDLLDEDNLPDNSDVVLTLSQYCAAMKQFHNKYYGYITEIADHGWFIGK
jgi:Ni,Fe-hydrogenase III component G